MKPERIQPATLVSFAACVLFFTAASIAASAQVTVLHDFKDTDGATPNGSLLFDTNGNLYGTTMSGGSNNVGAVYTLTPSNGKWAEKVIHNFKDIDGSLPQGGLVFDTNGNLFGTTTKGGTKSDGTVFKLIPNNGKWTEAVVHDFSGLDGSTPQSTLLFATTGDIYGVTSTGGAKNDGAVFALVPSSDKWTETVIHSFNGGDGGAPWGALIADAKGNLYGTTSADGVNSAGTVFELVQSKGKWTEKVLYSFNSTNGDASTPYGALLADSNGNLYGTSSKGGANGAGAVFELTRGTEGGYTESVLYSFLNNGSDGTAPWGGLVMDTSGNLWGTTSAGGSKGMGTIFELTSDGTGWLETVMHNFNVTSGATPYSGLILDTAGNLYGTTSAGGTNGKGIVFEFTPEGVTPR
ncbi:MAG TPA: choice-of-anchor tandem repeat GloVer-containing protein [Terriglobales bacterium]